MLTDREYAEAIIKGKGFQRAHVVQVLFGGQEALARELGISRYAVNHAIYSRSASQRIEEYVLARIRKDRPELEKLWERPWAKKNGKQKAA